MSLSDKSYTGSLKKTLRSRHQSDFNKAIRLPVIHSKERVMQELHFKEFSKTLIGHFNNMWSMMFLAKKLYSEYFQKKYEEKLQKCHSELLEKELGVAVKDFKTFAKIMAEIVILSYNLGKYQLIFNENLITREAVSNLILNDFFSWEIGKIFENAVFKLETPEIEVLAQKMEAMKDVKPENFDVPGKYCLNSMDFDYSALNENENPGNQIAYFKTINFLKEIFKLKSPGEKIDHIMKTAELLLREIGEFYESNGKLEEELGGDEILALFVYIVAKTGCPQLVVQCKIIDLFMTSNQMNSIVGYYLATIQVAIKYISLNKKKSHIN